MVSPQSMSSVFGFSRRTAWINVAILASPRSAGWPVR